MGKQKRNWGRYNENLVQRGEILLKVDVLKDWKQQVAAMNMGKRGRPFAGSVAKNDEESAKGQFLAAST